jgi:hypothetical protein
MQAPGHTVTRGGTYFNTRHFGQTVGEDKFGNRYYHYTQQTAIEADVGAECRWVTKRRTTSRGADHGAMRRTSDAAIVNDLAPGTADVPSATPLG